MIIAISIAKPQNTSIKPVDKLKPRAGQNFVVNNNCGMSKTEREIMAYIKTKVDYIAAQSGRGKSIFSEPLLLASVSKF